MRLKTVLGVKRAGGTMNKEDCIICNTVYNSKYIAKTMNPIANFAVFSIPLFLQISQLQAVPSQCSKTSLCSCLRVKGTAKKSYSFMNFYPEFLGTQVTTMNIHNYFYN